MARCAAEHKRFLMEALWTRFFPAVAAAREAIARGEIGEVVGCTVQFGFNDRANTPRLRQKQLGGGALLDVGVYCLHVVSPQTQSARPLKSSAALPPGRARPDFRTAATDAIARGTRFTHPGFAHPPVQAAVAFGSATPSSVAPTACALTPLNPCNPAPRPQPPAPSHRTLRRCFLSVAPR